MNSRTKAAENLFMTQPALSTSIRKTESRIGMPLFDRSRHPLRLTEAGKLYIQTIEQLKRQEETLARQL